MTDDINASGHVSQDDLCSSTEKTPDVTASSAISNVLVDQESQLLPHKQLMIVFPVLALAQFTAYLDQTSISTVVPTIGEALDLGSSLSWVATSYLLATTVIQLINDRLSDIFGRKRSIMMSLAVLGLGNLVTGFSKSPGMIFASRMVSGLGGGAM